MTIENNKQIPLNKDVVLLIKGLLVGKILTLLVIGSVLWWLRPHLWRWSYSAAPSNQTSTIASAASTTNFQTINNVPFGTFSYGGSTAWAPIRLLVDSQIQNVRPELKLQYLSADNSAPSSSTGIRMLLDGKLDFAQSSRPLTQEEKALAQQRGLTLQQLPVAVDGIAVVVHPSLNLPGLTVDQLQQIYQGKITNWKQVGGSNLPITPFSEPQQEGDAAIFSDRKDGQQSFGSNVQFISSPTEALRQVKQTPGGIYYSSARAVVNQCSVKPIDIGLTLDRLIPPYSEPFVPSQQCPSQRNQPNTETFANGTYPLTRNLFVIIKQNQGREQQVGEAYANLLQTAQGQQAIAQAGFAWLRQNNSPVAANTTDRQL
jgi:phosphate transport system substrate-binding protein